MNHRKYYAEYCLYGVNTSYDSFNRNAYDFYCFDSKQARDKWVSKYAYDNNNNMLVAASTTLEKVRYCKGAILKYFIMLLLKIIMK